MTEGDEDSGRKLVALRLVAKSSSARPESEPHGGGEAPASVIDHLVGREISIRRNELGMTQQALGGALGLSAEAIDGYEAGRFRIGPKMLVNLANVLQCEPSAFFRSISEGHGVDAAKIRDPYLKSTNDEKELDAANDKLLDAIDNIYDLIASLMRLKRGDKPS